MKIKELKDKFINSGFFVDEKNNIVILSIEKNNDTHDILSADIENLVKNWNNIIKFREKNGWDEILKKLGM